MNPLTQVRQIKKINEQELALGIAGERKSWHDVYKGSAWSFVGGLNFDLTEGDVISVFSQYGEVVNMNMVRDQKTGKSRGFAFICYEDQRSTVLAVDNLNGIKLIGRTIRVDHVANYKPPKEKGETDELTRLIYERGCGPEINIHQLENEAAKREARKGFDRKFDDERPPRYDKPRPRDRELSPSAKGIKVEYDDDGDVRRGNIKVEFDEEGDVRRETTSIKREYDDDADLVISSKRRSIETSSRKYESPSRHYEERRSHEDEYHRHSHNHSHH